MSSNKDISMQLTNFYEFAELCHDALIWETDEKFNIKYVNKAFYKHVGLTNELVIGNSLEQILPTEEPKYWDKIVQSNLSYQGVCLRVILNNGQHLQLKVSGKTVFNNDVVVGYIGVCTFESESAITNRIISKLKSTNQIILKSINDALIVVDKNDRIIVASPGFKRMWGFQNVKLFHTHFVDLLGKMKELLAYGENSFSFGVDQQMTDLDDSKDVIRFKDGRHIERKSKAFMQKGAVQGKCWYFTDITEHKILVDKLERLAFRDSLTSLYNRRWCENKLKQLLITDKNNSLSFIYMDLDHFKVINDSCGHIYGDDVLEEISHLLLETVGRKAYLSRLGGDEFGLILVNKSYAQVLEISNSILLAISNYTYKLKKKIFKIGISLGLVIIDEEDDFRSIFVHADEACYLSKKTGRNKCTIYNVKEEEFKKTQKELKWYDAIQKALLKNQFELWCQSINDIKEPISHFEVLLRMRTENNQVYSPGLFMESADRFGMIYTIDRKVIELFCKFYYRNKEKLKDTLFSINLSGYSISREDFLPYVLRSLNQYDIDSKNICFEITESEVINNIDKALVFLAHVRNVGCKISLDDFGKGFTSFSYLKNIPFDYIKIDGQFIQELNKDKINTAIIKSIVYISETMEKKTIAEHIENQVQLLKVASLGVNYFQGHYFSKPHQITKLVE